jgi:hypothetical protein
MQYLTFVSFNKEVATVLKQNQVLMEYVKGILDGTNEDGTEEEEVSDELKNVADGLLWKLEKEDQLFTGRQRIGTQNIPISH